MQSSLKSLLGAATMASLLTFGSTAQADPSGWLHFGSGVYGWSMQSLDEREYSPSLTIDVGVGSDSDAPFIVGGLFRLQPVIEYGTDVSWIVRGATRGFQSEWFGFAVDVGPYVRGWGDGSAGLSWQGLLGGPLGLQLAALGSYGSNEASAFGATLGIDLARLTVHRKHLFDWWPNPRPVEKLDERQNAGR